MPPPIHVQIRPHVQIRRQRASHQGQHPAVTAAAARVPSNCLARLQGCNLRCFLMSVLTGGSSATRPPASRRHHSYLLRPVSSGQLFARRRAPTRRPRAAAFGELLAAAGAGGADGFRAGRCVRGRLGACSFWGLLAGQAGLRGAY